MQGDEGDKSPSRRGLYRQSDITENGSLHTKGPYRQGCTTDKRHYRQGALINKEFIQTKGLYSKIPLKGPLQTLCNFYRQEVPT